MYSKLILLTPPLVHCGTLHIVLYTLELLLVFSTVTPVLTIRHIFSSMFDVFTLYLLKLNKCDMRYMTDIYCRQCQIHNEPLKSLGQGIIDDEAFDFSHVPIVIKLVLDREIS